MTVEGKEKDRQDRDDISWIMSTIQGRRFVWRMLSHCGVYRGHEGDSEQVMKQEGRRQAGLFLLGIISDASEDHVFDMMKEAKQQSIEEKIKYDNANNARSNSDISSGTSGYATDSGTPIFIDDFIGDSFGNSSRDPGPNF
jgi:hypothetical protein